VAIAAMKQARWHAAMASSHGSVQVVSATMRASTSSPSGRRPAGERTMIGTSAGRSVPSGSSVATRARSSRSAVSASDASDMARRGANTTTADVVSQIANHADDNDDDYNYNNDDNDNDNDDDNNDNDGGDHRGHGGRT
jgi:hypothetical protein